METSFIAVKEKQKWDWFETTDRVVISIIFCLVAAERQSALWWEHADGECPSLILSVLHPVDSLCGCNCIESSRYCCFIFFLLLLKTEGSVLSLKCIYWKNKRQKQAASEWFSPKTLIWDISSPRDQNDNNLIVKKERKFLLRNWWFSVK